METQLNCDYIYFDLVNTYCLKIYVLVMFERRNTESENVMSIKVCQYYSNIFAVRVKYGPIASARLFLHHT